jgi:hypothetical protein
VEDQTQAIGEEAYKNEDKESLQTGSLGLNLLSLKRSLESRMAQENLQNYEGRRTDQRKRISTLRGISSLRKFHRLDLTRRLGQTRLYSLKSLWSK